MPWWVVIYGAVLAGLIVAAVWGDIRDHRPAWHVACEALSSTCLVFFVVAYWHPEVRWGSAGVVALLLGLSIVWELYSARVDIADATPDPELSDRENAITDYLGAAGALILLVPAYVHGWWLITGA
jgi:hypothetical protein